ncbi:efflux RND transporter periplasmic adaptor subunit [Marinicella rhabdoformis]|uniref:efflux RND transporter periplasmic adaptor subunit n=1 Tax=Marinicella rhabdoformis TaxID=2580566 RepID=UPI0012AED789|nr:efflux RND transporter periplasmic adaptor subunit [Marinicella rhabdoformis]
MFKSNSIAANVCNINKTTHAALKSLLLSCTALIIGCSVAMAQDPIKVDAIYPQPLGSGQNIVLTGTVEAKQNARLAPLESGLVAALNVEVGDNVTQGQVLLSLNSKLMELEVQGALAEVEVAEVDRQESKRLYAEAQRLSEKNMVAKTLIDERASMVASTEAELARVIASLNLQQERLKRHRLLAPFDGVIGQRNVDVGEWVTPQTAVLTLVAQNDLRLVVAIPQQYYSRLITHAEVSIKVIPDAAGSAPFAAKLSRLVPVSDSTTRTFTAQIDLPDSQNLVAGMSARAEIALPDGDQVAFVLPRYAIKQHPDGGSSVFVVENNTAKRIVTSYTTLPDDKVAVYNLPADQAYIITAVELLQEGMPVTVNVISGSEDD